MDNGFRPQRPQYSEQSRSLSPLPQSTQMEGGSDGMHLEQLRSITATTGTAEESKNRAKRKRASKACDACRVRKVKCDAAKNPCPQCQEHGIPCEFTVPVKRRGPVNAYVEMQKQKLELEAHGISCEPGPQPLSNPGFLEQRTDPALLANTPGYNMYQSRPDRGLEELAPPNILNLMFDDFFKFVYPIAPLIIESAFRRVLSNASLHTDEFLALAGSILGCTLACLRSSESLYGGLTVEHTYQFTTARLGINYRDRLNLQIAATLEYLGLAAAYAHPVKLMPANSRASLLVAEFGSTVQFLISTRFHAMTFMEQQLLKRMYHYIFYVQISCEMQGAPNMAAYLKHRGITDMAPDDMLPVDVSDEELDRVVASGEDHPAARRPFSELLVPNAMSYVPGLLLLSNLYIIFAESYDIRNDKTLPKHARYAGLCHTLHKVQHALDNAPVQLRWEENNKVHGLGFEVQKANLYVSKMHISSVLLEKIHQIDSEMNDSNSSLSSREDLEGQRRQIISETLRIIKTISPRALEANGFSMIKRVRQVASSLVDIIQTQKISAEEHASAQKELSEFVEILGNLDQSDERLQLNGPPETARSEDGWKNSRSETTKSSKK